MPSDQRHDITNHGSSVPAVRPDRGHPEDTCQACGGANVVWFAPNELWNQVMGDETGIVCPRCFVLAAEAAGIVEIWKLAPSAPRAPEPTRFEVIDHRHPRVGYVSRAFIAHDVAIELSYQDDGRTLKVFVRDRPAGGASC